MGMLITLMLPIMPYSMGMFGSSISSICRGIASCVLNR
nr:hypothetical protein Q903MT_gene2169 [Picea sitchensis]